MRVADVYSDCKGCLGTTDQTTVFQFITDAVTILAAKGAWEVRKQYLDLPVQSNNLVTLPTFVETVLKANISNTPGFSRDRLYEFSINGPGSTATRTDFSWEDKGFVPTMVPIPGAYQVGVSGSNTSSDHGLKVVVRGLDADNVEITETIAIAQNQINSNTIFTKLIEVNKDATTEQVTLRSVEPGHVFTTLSIYQGFETECKYRQIRLSKTGSTVRLLVLRKTFKITSVDDFIPVASAIGLRLMIKALIAYQRTEVAVARAYEEDAVRITTEAQKSLTGFIDLAKETEMDSARGINYNNRDSIIVADVYDDIAKIVGPIGQSKIFDKATEALEALHNKGHWDGLTGYVDISTDGGRYVTFPRYVESPIQINLGGRPLFMRNKWFEFHINGPGSCECGYDCAGAWDWVGDVVTQQPLQYVAQVVAVPDSLADNGKTITIYGLDDNHKPLTTNGVNGLVLTVASTKPLPLANDQKITRIDRITRDATASFVRFMGYAAGDQTQSVQLGYWYPDETEPNYTRIKLPTYSTWVRMRYRKRTLKISSLYDQIHLKSKAALVTMVDALEVLRSQKDVEKCNQLTAKAMELLEDEQRSRNPGETFQFQVDATFGGSNLILV